MYRVWNFIAGYSVLLIGGAVIALLWVNMHPDSYRHFVEYPLWFNGLLGTEFHHWHQAYGPASNAFETGDVDKVLTVHYLVNDLLMALFFAMAGKEVWEALILKNGALRGRKAATPLIATAGGMLGPVLIYLGLAAILGSDIYDAVHRGWAIPTATDIAFSYLLGRIVFGAGHPAMRFLLLLAIADDAGGLIILAIFYPSGDLAPEWLLVSAFASGFAYVAFNWLPRRMDRGDQTRARSTWVRLRLKWYPYAIAGLVSLFAFTQSGLHPALGLLPVIPAIPHADRAFGIFAEAESHLHDILNDFERALQAPVELILLFFGLVNAGVVFSAVAEPTWLVFGGLALGKPVGIFLMGLLAARLLKLGLPQGMRLADLAVVGCVASIGFTVSLFVASVAFEPGPLLDAAKMGALFSSVAIFVSLAAGRLLRVKKQPG